MDLPLQTVKPKKNILIQIFANTVRKTPALILELSPNNMVVTYHDSVWCFSSDIAFIFATFSDFLAFTVYSR